MNSKSSKDFDVIIIGAGMGGLIAGAILAKKERLKVLVLEKLSEIGGRCISFGGPSGSDYSSDEMEQLLYGGAYSSVLKSEPDFPTLIKKGILKDYIIDGGWHAMSGGDRCRYALLARLLGKPLKVSNVIGMAFRGDGKWLQLPELVKGWPKESHDERKRVAFERMLLSIEEASEYDHVDLKTYLESVTSDKLVQDYYSTLARWQVGINEPSRLSAGEWIKCNNATSSMGRHLITGGGMGEVTGGFKVIASAFSSIIEENGGEVRLSTPVEEVIIKSYQAKGVVVNGAQGREEINAPFVVCNVPVYGYYNIIDKSHFPLELRRKIEKMYPIGAILGNVSLREPLETHQPKGQWLVDRLPGKAGLKVFGGPPVFGMEQTSIVDPTRAPKDRVLTQICLIVASRKDPDELMNLPLMNEVADDMMKFIRETYPRFDDIVDWYFITKVDMSYGVEPAPGLVGDQRIPVQHPTVRNLFFTGDCVTQWDVGSNGAAHGAVLCASALSEKNYLKLLPPYWR